MQMICKYTTWVKLMRKEYVTKTRNLILKYILDHKNNQFSATDISDFMQVENCQINLTTVYRNLDKLTEEGTLIRYKYADDNCCMYQYAGDSDKCQHHLHMKCQNCGKIFHLECDFMNEISKHLLEDHGFILDCKGSVMIGSCEDCRKQK